MKESEIEARLVRGVKALGGVAYKFVSPGKVGVPDRVVVLPGGRVIFVERKAEGGRRSPMQRQQLARRRRLGADAREVKSETGVARFLEDCCNRLEGGDAQ